MPSNHLFLYHPLLLLPSIIASIRVFSNESALHISWPNYGASASVQFSSSVVSNSLWPHGLQHARLPCPSPTPVTYSNSCPLSWWCYPTISSSVVPFSSCFQSFPASRSFPMSQFFASGGQNSGVSASASVLPMNIQFSFRMDWLNLLAVQGTLKGRPYSAFFNDSAWVRQFLARNLTYKKKGNLKIRTQNLRTNWQMKLQHSFCDIVQVV